MSRVKHSFKYSWPEGVTPMLLHEWVETLPKEQQQEFYDSQQRQLDIRAGVIDEGSLELVDNEYIWKDESRAQRNKPYDKIWRAYFDRYLEETQTIFEVVEEKIDGEE